MIGKRYTTFLPEELCKKQLAFSTQHKTIQHQRSGQQQIGLNMDLIHMKSLSIDLFNVVVGYISNEQVAGGIKRQPARIVKGGFCGRAAKRTTPGVERPIAYNRGDDARRVIHLANEIVVRISIEKVAGCITRDTIGARHPSAGGILSIPGVIWGRRVASKGRDDADGVDLADDIIAKLRYV